MSKVRKTSETAVKPATRAKPGVRGEAPKVASEVVWRVAGSLSDLLRQLAFVSYKLTEDSGDYRHAGNGGRRGCYKQFWEDVYQFAFFAGFYTLDDALQRDPMLRGIAKAAQKTYNQTLADTAACLAAYREPLLPSKRLAALRIDDGARVRKLAPITFGEILGRMKDDRVLVGWQKGLPPGLAHQADRQVLGGVISGR